MSRPRQVAHPSPTPPTSTSRARGIRPSLLQRVPVVLAPLCLGTTHTSPTLPQSGTCNSNFERRPSLARQVKMDYRFNVLNKKRMLSALSTVTPPLSFLSILLFLDVSLHVVGFVFRSCYTLLNTRDNFSYTNPSSYSLLLDALPLLPLPCASRMFNDASTLSFRLGAIVLVHRFYICMYLPATFFWGPDDHTNGPHLPFSNPLFPFPCLAL